MRYQAILAAVNAGSLPASVLDEQDDEDDEIEATIGEERDDERGGTKYNVSWQVLPDFGVKLTYSTRGSTLSSSWPRCMWRVC
jgi:hypothetical protein